MPNLNNDAVFRLIKSLTKAEKRNFTLYANRISHNRNLKFLQVFELLVKQKEYDEAVLIKKVDGLKKSQLSNIKRHLYRQILASIRQLSIQSNIDIEIGEQIDFARILYNKGFYMDSLKVLDKAKALAKTYHQDIQHLRIVEFEKLIELRHITRSDSDRAESLTQEVEKRTDVITTRGQLSNLSIRLYGWYIKIGHVKREEDYISLSEFFRSNLPAKLEEEMTFFEKIDYYQCHVWFYHILLNFVQSYKYAQKWLDLFDEYPDQENKDLILVIQGYHNLLSALYHTGYHSKFSVYLQKFEELGLRYQGQFTTNEQVYYSLYLYNHKINDYFTRGLFSEGIKLIPELEGEMWKYEEHLDEHRILVSYYRVACLYFGSGDAESALDYLNRIINFSVGNLREDIQCFARILHLICHYELGHFNLLEYLVKSVYRFLRKMEELNEVQQEILSFLRKALHSNVRYLTPEFLHLRDKLKPLEDSNLEKRSFLYLDIISWLTSKIENRPVQEVIQEKFKRNYR